jgi:ABC-type transport system substrate-binding protein
VLKLLGVASGGVALAGCSSGGSTSETDSGSDGTADQMASDQQSDKEVSLRIGIASKPWNFDPALFTDTASSLISTLVYDELIGLTPDNELRPELTTELAQPVDDAGKVWDFTLREGVKFHNGNELTAEDLVYNFEWIANPDNNAAVLGYAPQMENATVTKQGEYAVRLELSEPMALWNAWLTRVVPGVVPKDSRGETSETKGPKGVGTDLTTDPIGTGPFEFDTWESGNFARLTAFEDHFRNDGEPTLLEGDIGPPLVDEIRFDFITEPSTRLSNVRAGKVDMINRVPPKDFESLDGASGVTAESIPGRQTITNYFNLNPRAFDETNPVANRHNRRAIHFAIDAGEVLKNAWYDQGVVQKGPWFPESEWTSPRLKEMDMYDLEKARAEIEQGPNPDGFSVTYMTRNTSVWRQTASVIQSQLEEIGVEVEIQAIDKSTLFTRLYNTSRWHMAGANWFQSIGQAFWWLFAGFAPQRNHNNWHHQPEDGGMPNEVWKPNGPDPPESARDEFGTETGAGHKWYQSRIQDALSTTDEERQKNIAHELEEYIVEHAIQSDMAYINRIEAWQSGVEDYQLGRFAAEYRTAHRGSDSA